MVLKLIEASDQRHLYIFRRPGPFIDLYFRSQNTNIIDKNKLKLVLYEHDLEDMIRTFRCGFDKKKR